MAPRRAGAAGQPASATKRQRQRASGLAQESQAHALKRILNYLQGHPELVLTTLPCSENGAIARAYRSTERAKGMEGPWPETYTRLNKVPKYFMATFLAEVARVPETALWQADDSDKTVIEALFWFTTATEPSYHWPPGGRDRLVFARTWQRRAAQMQRDAKPFWATVEDGGEGVIAAFQQHGVFSKGLVSRLCVTCGDVA